jgi:hypothetical protein
MRQSSEESTYSRLISVNHESRIFIKSFKTPYMVVIVRTHSTLTFLSQTTGASSVVVASVL